jgi:hypothetical protein
VTEALDVEETFINGEHRFIVDPDYDNEQEGLLYITEKKRKRKSFYAYAKK